MFGRGKKGGAALSPEEAIQKLKEVEQMLHKKTDVLEGKIEQQLKIAKENGIKKKRVALQALKRKKLLEKQLTLIDGQLTNIEVQQNALDNSLTNTEVLMATGAAKQTLKITHETMDVDDVQELMEDMREQQETANEISEILSRPAGFDQGVDDDELEAELQELIKETSHELPSVPMEELVAPRTEGAKAEKAKMKEPAQLAS